MSDASASSRRRCYAGERLTRDDGVALYESDDLAWLGGLAHHVRTQKNGDGSFFNVNRHLNLTNVCAASCAYCSFQRKPGEKDAYTMRIEEAVRAGQGDGAGRASPSCTSSTACTRRCRGATTRAVDPRAEGRAAGRLAQGVHRHRDPLVREDLRPVRRRDPRRADRRRPRVADRRRRRDLRLGGPRSRSSTTSTHWEDWSRIHRLAHSKGLQDPVHHAVRAHRGAASPGRPRAAAARAAGRDRRASSSSSRCATSTTRRGDPRNRLKGRTADGHRRRGAEDLRGLAAALRQRPAREVLLGDARAHHRPAVAVLRRRRPGRLGRRVQDHPRRGQLRHAEQDDPRRPARADPRRGLPPVERNTRYEIIREYDGPDVHRRDEPQPMRV